MQCPIDQTDLQMTERQGIEIDYCPKCRGVWLDRGELDKIIERNMGQDSRGSYQEERRYEERPQSPPGQQRKRSFLSDLFEFD
jgi:Zn-finger nucleic acid-binding protein